jgi:hypothetical protein
MAHAPLSTTWCSSLLHRLDRERDPVRHAAQNANGGLAIDEYLLDEVHLREELVALGARPGVEEPQTAEKVFPDGAGLKDGEIHVMELHVHYEVIRSEELARGVGVVALLPRDRERGRAAGAGKPVHRVEHHECGRRSRGAAHELASRHLQAAGAAIGLFAVELRGRPLLRRRGARTPLAVRDVGERKRELGRIQLAAHSGPLLRRIPSRGAVHPPGAFWPQIARESRSAPARSEVQRVSAQESSAS